MYGLGNQVGRCGNGYQERTANKQRSKQNLKCTTSDLSDEKLDGIFYHGLCLLSG